jgi:hypothetical protein
MTTIRFSSRGTMLEYPEFLNVRKLALALAFGPLALLLFFGLLDVSMHHPLVLQASGQSCMGTDATGSMTTLYGSECHK